PWRARSGDTDWGRQYAAVTLGPCALRAFAFASRMRAIALRNPCARTLISIGSVRGLATVSIIAAVSPNPLRNWIGPAPCGRELLSQFNFRLMSLNCLLVSVTLSASCT